MTQQKPWQTMNFAFVVDPNARGLIKQKMNIFDYARGDVLLQPCHDAIVEIRCAESTVTYAQQCALEVLQDSSFWGVFKSNLSISAASDGQSEVETMRLDSMQKSTHWLCVLQEGPVMDPASKMLNPVKQFCNDKTVQEIAKTVGVFYPISCKLGGRYTASFCMEKSEDDNESVMKAELYAKYGKNFFEVAVEGSAGITTRTSNPKAKMEANWNCQGGNPAIWLQATKDNMESIKQKWGESIDEDNLCAFDYCLEPIWKLIEHFNEPKAREMELYLTTQWGRSSVPVALRYALPAIADRGFSIPAHATATSEEMRKAGYNYGTRVRVNQSAGPWYTAGDEGFCVGGSTLVRKGGPRVTVVWDSGKIGGQPTFGELKIIFFNGARVKVNRDSPDGSYKSGSEGTFIGASDMGDGRASVRFDSIGKTPGRTHCPRCSELCAI